MPKKSKVEIEDLSSGGSLGAFAPELERRYKMAERLQPLMTPEEKEVLEGLEDDQEHADFFDKMAAKYGVLVSA